MPDIVEYNGYSRNVKQAEEEGRVKTILVVDDKANVRTLVKDYLTQENYRVVTAENGQQGLYAARHEKPDLILLDIMMPEMSGYDFLRAFRKEKDTPIILLTARMEESDKVLGLELGADDYVTKPFGMRELLARVKAQLRRVRLLRAEMAATEQQEPPRNRLIFGDLTIDKDRREVMLAGKSINLRPKEFELLLFLAHNRHVVLSRDLILERVWDWSYNGGSRTVDVHIRWLRERVEADPSHPQYIRTVRGVGYKIISPDE